MRYLTPLLLFSLISCSSLQAPPGYVYAPSIEPAVDQQIDALQTILVGDEIPEDWSPQVRDALIMQGQQLEKTLEAAVNQVEDSDGE